MADVKVHQKKPIAIVRQARSIAFLRRIPIELYFYDPDDYAGKDQGETLLLLKDVEERRKRLNRTVLACKITP